MQQVKVYVFSIIAVAMLCSLITHAMQSFRSKHLMKLICGVVITITVLRPFFSVEQFSFDEMAIYCPGYAQEVVSIGKEISYSAWVDIIKLKTEAYILDKASDMGADISVSVFVLDSDEPIPVAVEITGFASPYVRQRIEQILEEDLGIAKENQLWIG